MRSKCYVRIEHNMVNIVHDPQGEQNNSDPISNIAIHFMGEEMDVSLYMISIPVVEAYLSTHPNEIVLHAPYEDDFPGTIMTISLRHPFIHNDFIHIPVLENEMYIGDDEFVDVLTIIQSNVVPRELFSEIPALGPMHGDGVGGGRRHKRNKRKTHHRRNKRNKRMTKRNKRKQSSKRRAH
jgi:hypothetical protein